MRIRKLLPVVAITLGPPFSSLAQTQVDLRTQSKRVDFSNALSTKPFKTGSSLPPTCVLGEAFFKTNAAAGQNLYTCSSADTWTLQSGTTSSANGFTVVAFSSTPTFMATAFHATTFLLVLTGNVNSSNVSGASAGDLLMFRICQDEVGGRVFTWPANVLGAGTINVTANVCTNQSFVFDGSNALPISGAMMTGVSGGIITMPGSTSGTTTLQAAAAAGGTLTFPARTATLATTVGPTTVNHCAQFDANGNLIDSGAACGGGAGSSGGTQQWFAAATCGTGYASAAAWDMDSSNPNPLLCSYMTTGGPTLGVMQFSSAADGYAWLSITLPDTFSSVNIKLKAWRGNSNAGDTRYVLEGRCLADGDTGGSAFPNSSSVINGAAAPYSLQTYSFTNFPTSGCNGGDILLLQLHRDHTCTGCAEGNMAGTSYFKGAEVEIQ
jgi:hypothetical protein